MCPISSAEIAQLNGGFQQIAANNFAFAQQLGQGSVYGGGAAGHPGGDRMVGGAMNRMSSIGAPLAAGAMGIMGLDPMSLGIRAGMGAFGSGAGFGGAALAGGAVAMPLMAAGAAASYAGGQMMTGANQQYALNNTLRNSFSFRNGAGGQGFSRADQSAIGEMVRTMSEQTGPGGEIASFSELTALTGKMGTMGLAQGVRDVKEFGHRFKEMVEGLKTMARDLGTTLEGAMEFASAARGSGIFGTRRANAFTSAARAATVSGGLALSEVTGAASIGSQIVRSVGGLGRQGAMAGIRTIGQIGTAQQMGVISDEDVYNATGLYGAEGRQALAASQMGKTADWLRSGRGRRLLASVAEKDGSLNEGSIQELLSGGMSIGETMRLDKGVSNGSRMSRANFIRNEGRLRGAAMERLGAFLPALQLQEWAQSKGIDINDMDDRSMLFAQRQLGMGRDEMDLAMKMVNQMPRILETQRRSEQQDKYVQQQGDLRKGQGIEGLKQRFDQARESLNGKLQKIGQNIFNEGAREVDEFMNRLLGNYVETYSKDIDDKYQAMRQGGVSGAKAASQAFGIGRESSAFGKYMRGGAGFNLGGVSQAPIDINAGSRGKIGDILGSPGQMMSFLMHGQSLAGKLEDAGINTKGLNSGNLQAKMNELEQSRIAAATGYDENQTRTIGKMGGDWLRTAYSLDLISGGNDKRMQSFESFLQNSARGGGENADKAKSLLAMWNGAKSQSERAQIMATAERVSQVGDKYALANHLGASTEVAGLLGKRGKFASESEENEAWAHAMGVGGGASDADRLKKAGMQADWLNLLMMKVGSKKRDGDVAAVGAFYKGKEGRDTLAGIFSDSAEGRATARDALQKAMGEREVGDDVRKEQQKLLAAGEYADLVAKGGGSITAAQEKDLVERYKSTGMTLDDIKQKTKSAYGALGAIQDRDRAEADRRGQVYATGESRTLGALGVYDAAHGTLTADTSKLSRQGQFLAKQFMEEQGSLLKEGLAGRGAEAKAGGLYQAATQSMAGLSTEDKRQLAMQFAGSDIGASLSGYVGAETRFAGLQKRQGTARAAGTFLGVNLSKEEAQGYDLTGAGASRLLARAGIQDNDLVKELQASAKVGGNTLADTLKRIADGMEADKQKKEQEKEDAKDELQKAMKVNSDRANQLLEKIALHSGVTAQEIAKLDKKDAEGNGVKPPQPT